MIKFNQLQFAISLIITTNEDFEAVVAALKLGAVLDACYLFENPFILFCGIILLCLVLQQV